MDREFERWMRSYEVPSPGSDLAQRIIDAAARIPRKRKRGEYIREIFKEVQLSVPAFCLTVFLLVAVGFLAGVVTQSDANSRSTAENFVEQLLNEDESLL